VAAAHQSEPPVLPTVTEGMYFTIWKYIHVFINCNSYLACHLYIWSHCNCIQLNLLKVSRHTRFGSLSIKSHWKLLYLNAHSFADCCHIWLIHNNCRLNDACQCIMLPEGRAYSRRFVRPSVRFCPSHNSESIRDTNLKLYRYIDLFEQKCSAQEL